MEPLLNVQPEPFLKRRGTIAVVFFLLGVLAFWVLSSPKEQKAEAPVEAVVAQAPAVLPAPDPLPLPIPAFPEITPAPSQPWKKLGAALPPAPKPVVKTSPAVTTTQEASPQRKPFVPHPEFKEPSFDSDDWVEKTLRGDKIDQD